MILSIVLGAYVVYFPIDINITSNSTPIPSQKYEDSLITFKYPSNWSVIANQTGKILVQVGGEPSVQSNNTTMLSVQKVDLAGKNLKTSYDATYNEMRKKSGFKIISENQVKIDGVFGYEITYNKKINDKTMKESAIWLEKDNNVYFIIFSTTKPNFDTQKKNLDLILRTFKFK